MSDPKPSAGAVLRVVVVGAGFGGLAVVKGLKGRPVAITLVDRQNHHLFQPLLYQVATAALSPADIAAPIRTIVKHDPHVQVILDEVVGVEADARTVRLGSGAGLAYDVLVVATGVGHSYFGRDDWARFAPGIKTIDDATRVRRSILLALERAESLQAEAPGRPEPAVTFVVVGGGPTGVEMAGAIAELTRHAAAMDFRHVDPDHVRILLLEAGPRLLPAFPEDLSRCAAEALGELGVELMTGRKVVEIDAERVTLEDGAIAAAAVVWAAGVKASPAGTWLGAPTDRAGRVLVEPDLTLPGRPEVYVIGDTAAAPDGRGGLTPGVAPGAKQQGEFVARRIARLAEGKRPSKAGFRYRDYGALATIGRQRAVMDLGGIHLHGWVAWLLWSTAHLYFLVGFRNRLLVGISWLWSYVTFDRGVRLITGIGGAREE